MAAESHVPVATGDAQGTSAHHHEAEEVHREAEQVRLDLGQTRGNHLALEQHGNQEVGQCHEGQRGTDHHGGVEVAGHVDGVVDQQVELLGTHHHAGDTAQEAEAHQRNEHTGEGRVAPGRLAQPLKQTLVVAARTLGHFHGARDGQGVDHGCQHSKVHEVAGVHHFPLGTDAGVGKQVVGTGELQEQDVQQEGATADALGHGLGAKGDGGHGVPDRDVGGHVDLLRRVTEGPPDGAVDQGIDFIDQADGHQEGRDQDDRARADGEHGDDGCRDGAKGHQRHRALVGLFALGDDQRAEEHEAGDQRTHGEQDQAEIEGPVRHHGHIGGHHHAGTALEHRHVVHDGTNQHERVGGPCNLGCRQSASQEGG